MATGAELHTFKGHEAPVHSVCPHSRETVHVRTQVGYSFSADMCCNFASSGFSHSLLMIVSCFYALVCLFNISGWKNKGVVV